MRSYWFTILLALTLGGLGAYIYFVDLPAERTKALEESEQATLLPLKEDAITSLSIRSPSGEIILEPDKDDGWHITAPIQTEADSRAVEALIRALTLGRISRVVEQEATDLAPFGLADPPVVVTVTTASRRETLSLGDSGPITSTLYALRGSDRTILLTTLAPKDFFNKTVTTFRKREVLTFDPSDVKRIRLTYPQTEFAFYRTGQKGKEKWRLRFPIEADADQAEVNGLLVKLQNLKAIGFIDDDPSYQAVTKRFGKPKAKVTLRGRGGDQVVKLFQPDPGSGEAFAVTGREVPLYRINPMVINDLTKDLFAVRDKRILGIDPDDVAVLEVKTREVAYVLINQNNEWLLQDQLDARLNRETVSLFVSRVASLPAELQVLKRAGPLAPYGLASPTAEFTATDRQGTSARLVLGTRRSGLVYAKGTALPGIYQARSDILHQIPRTNDLLAEPRHPDPAPG